MNQVILKVSGGIVEPVKIPREMEIIIRDYDLAETGDVPTEIIQIDENGDKFVEILFGDFDS
jgi:hypothetical protein